MFFANYTWFPNHWWGLFYFLLMLYYKQKKYIWNSKEKNQDFTCISLLHDTTWWYLLSQLLPNFNLNKHGTTVDKFAVQIIRNQSWKKYLRSMKSRDFFIFLYLRSVFGSALCFYSVDVVARNLMATEVFRRKNPQLVMLFNKKGVMPFGKRTVSGHNGWGKQVRSKVYINTLIRV